MQEYKYFSTPKEVFNWVNLHYAKEILDQLNVKKNPESPLTDYKGKAFHEINRYVRHHEEDKQSDYDIKGIQGILLSMTFCESITTFRFVSFKELRILLCQTAFGRIYEYPAFLSTTLLKDYYAMDDIKRGRLPIAIHIPQNTNGTYIPEVNPEIPEFEILLPYRLRMKRISWNVYEIVPTKLSD